MMRQDEMQHDIAYWLEHCGYEDVVDALIAACDFWATTETHDLLHHTTPTQWGTRVNLLRQLLWDDQHRRVMR
jgi:hypothetical protein